MAQCEVGLWIESANSDLPIEVGDCDVAADAGLSIDERDFLFRAWPEGVLGLRTMGRSNVHFIRI